MIYTTKQLLATYLSPLLSIPILVASSLAFSAEVDKDLPNVTPLLAPYVSKHQGDSLPESVKLKMALGRAANLSIDTNAKSEILEALDGLQLGGSNTPYISSRSDATIDEACSLISSQEGSEDIDAVSVAELFVLADQQAEEDTVSYYNNVISKLDGNTQVAIEEELTRISNDDSMAEFRTDFISLAYDHPQWVFNSFKQGCKNR